MAWVKFFTKSYTDFDGYVVDKDQLAAVIEAYELETHSRYGVCRSRYSYNIKVDAIEHQHWKIVLSDPKASRETVQPRIPDDEIPFIPLGSCTMDCKHGSRRKNKSKQKCQEISGMIPGISSNAKKNRNANSQKLDCPSIIKIRRILKFPQYQVPTSTSAKTTRDILFVLNEKLCNVKTKHLVKVEDRFYIHLPLVSSHINHVIGEEADVQLGIDKRIRVFIHQKVKNENVCNAHEMLNMVHKYVCQTLFKDKVLPAMSNTRYWPHLSQIRNHMKCRDNTLDQADLTKMVEKWQEEFPEDTYELRFRPIKKTNTFINSSTELNNVEDSSIVLNSGKKKFLFVQQTTWQRKLLYMYGDEMCILDYYRPAKFALPLFFLVVPTNYMYVVVASFITETESKADIEDAIGVVKSWNPGWHPKSFMCDFSEAKMGAIESVFKDWHTEIFICDYHRLQCWDRWLSTKSNKIGEAKDQVLELMCNIAGSFTEVEYQERLLNLSESEFWKSNPILQRWFKKWISNAARWVKFYRQDRYIIVDTNIGMEGLNGMFNQMFHDCN